MADRRVYLAARVRPLTPRELSMGAKSCVVVDGSCTTIVNPETGDAKAFVLDYSFDSSDPTDRSGWHATNDTVFREVGTQIVKHTLEGYNVCLFAHGPSGAGKTYTLVGQESDPGLLPRVLEAVFQQDAVVKEQLAVSASFYEIKDEQVRDILKQDLYSPGGLKVRTLPNGGGSVIEGLSAAPLREMLDCEELLAQILKYLGAIEPSAHTVFTLELFRRSEVFDASGRPQLVPYSSLRIIDLAGAVAGSTNDKLSKIGGPKGAKAPSADKSLLAWANVMSALAENQLQMQAQTKGPKVFVPFRGSTLTRVLEGSLGERSRCYIIANLSPSHLAYKETLNTFRDIVRTKEVKKVERNEQILNAYMGDSDFIPAAGGGWRWAYCAKAPEAPPPA